MLLREVEHTKCSLGGTRGVWAPCGSRFWLAGCLQEGPPWRGARGLLLVRTVRDGVSTSPCADYLLGGTRAQARGSQPRLAAARANRAPLAQRRLARVPTTAWGWAQRMGNHLGAGGKRGEILPAATSPEAHPSIQLHLACQPPVRQRGEINGSARQSKTLHATGSSSQQPPGGPLLPCILLGVRGVRGWVVPRRG